MTKDRLMPVLATIAVACMVVALGFEISDRINRGPDQPQPPVVGGTPDPVPVADWEQYLDGGHRIGSPNAKVVMVEFGDYECPMCRRFHDEAMRELFDMYPDDFAVVYRHFPIPNHRFAYPAARAAECAAAQGRFAEYHDALYTRQDSLGLKSWTAYAVTAGVQDTAAFGSCAAESGKVPLIEADIVAAENVGVTGTPALLLGGKLYMGAYPFRTLQPVVEELLRR